MTTSSPAVFWLAEPTTTPGDRDALARVWTAAPQDAAAAFSLEAEAPPETALWVADLPADTARAGLVLESAEHSLALSDRALVDADRRLASHVLRVQKAGGISFNITEDVARPELALDQILADLDYDPQTASFGIGDDVRGALAQAGQRFEAYLERLEQQLGHFAWVETRRDGHLLARTVVDWTGDVETRWMGQATALRVTLHRRTVTLALGSRLNLLRTLAVVSRNAIKLAKLPVLLATPGGVVLALPLAWRFIQDVRNELD